MASSKTKQKEMHKLPSDRTWIRNEDFKRVQKKDPHIDLSMPILDMSVPSLILTVGCSNIPPTCKLVPYLEADGT